MAIVASNAMSGAQEALASSDDVVPPKKAAKNTNCDAFIMNGEAIISLSRNLSSAYAKMAKDQLPSNIEVNPSPSSLPQSTSAGVAFPSMKRRSTRSRLPVSVSQPDGVRRTKEYDTPERTPTLVEVEVPSSQENEKENVTTIDGATAATGKGDEPLQWFSEPSGNPSDLPVESPAKASDTSEGSSFTAQFSSSAAKNPEKSEVGSCDTFIIEKEESFAEKTATTLCSMSPPEAFTTAIESPVRHPKSVSAANSPSLRRILGTTANPASPTAFHSNSGTPTTAEGSRTGLSNVFVDRYGSLRSNTTGGLGDVPPGEERDAAALAARLYALRGYSISDVTEKLNEMSDSAQLVLVKYLELFQFSNLRIDQALREFLSRVELRGESSQRERLLRFFSSRYYDCNPSLFPSLDDVHTLTCALLLLNSDLHGPNGGRKMSPRDFITNIAHTGSEYKRDLLKQLYASIRDNAIVLNSSTDRTSQSGSTIGRRATMKKSLMQSTFEVDPDTQVEYKAGFLGRKCLYDSDGAKTPFGRRGWRVWYARLRGLALYFDVDETPRARSRYATFSNAIMLHHSFAEPAADYKKRQHVFRLRTANLGEYLFQTGSPEEMNQWCEQINFVAAAFSSRALPAPIASQGVFTRPRLPRMPSVAPLSQQLKSHEAAAKELRQQMERAQREAPPLSSKGKLVAEYFFRERCLHLEITRYTTYAKILRQRLRSTAGPRPSASCATEICGQDAELDNISYRRAVKYSP
ncbi:unnamed protein product [Caenorhabditis auriculariae]|uniref:Uncharacterized protein n=1 Tax=Caenorhabditis auriculariae TaxID=2777116 RepID=A0A8S1HSK7_9PELO|nr:unnamed protein product [Caenorhabditis auriculariae]